MKDEKKFQELLKKAIGERSQVEFSKLTGIGTAWLNRLIRGKNSSLPRGETLEKIAGASEGRVTLEELMEACGHEMAEYEEKKKNTPDSLKARDRIRELSEKLNGLRGRKFES